MTIPVALTIAGSDCSGGAGLQADLKTFASFEVHGLSAVTSVVSETPLTVSRIHPVPAEILEDQIRLLLESYPVAAIKTGMLHSRSLIEVTCRALAARAPDIPLVVDPVMVASTGDPLLADEALATICDDLLPLATLLTPNLPEAEFLLGRKITTPEDQERAAHDLAEKYQAACYLKGGHFEQAYGPRDYLVTGEGSFSFQSERLDLPQTHGTGCTLSAALAAGLARGETLAEAARAAHHFTHRALQDSLSWSAPHSGQRVSHLRQSFSAFSANPKSGPCVPENQAKG